MAEEVDGLLMEVFDGLANRTAGKGGASKVIMDGEMFFFCGAGVYKGPVDEHVEGLGENELAKYSDSLPIRSTNQFNKIKPEIFLEQDSMRILPEDCPALFEAPLGHVFIPCEKPPFGEPGILICRCGDAGIVHHVTTIPYTDTTRLLEKLPIRICYLPPELATVMPHIDFSKYKFEIKRTKLADLYVVFITGVYGTLYMALRTSNTADYVTTINKDGVHYSLDGWDTETKVFKRIIKKGAVNMAFKGLPSPLAGKTKRMAPLPPVTPPQPAVEEQQAVTEPPQPVVEDVTTHEDVQEAVTAAVEVPVQTEDRHQVIEPADAQTKDVKPRKRQQKPTAAIGYDFDKVLEYLGTQVDTIKPSEFDKAMAELRTLRDLQIAAARRAANISTQVFSASKDAVERVTALSAKMSEFTALLK